MGVGKRLAILIMRPGYRLFVEKPLWWFLGKVKVFFIAEISDRLWVLEDKLNKLQSIDGHLRQIEVSNASQWDGIEQLLLAVLRQPESRLLSSEHQPSAVEVKQLNGPNTIR